MNLAWVDDAPALAVVFAPLTALFGPVAAYNVAAVLLPAVSAWSGFLLCRHVVGRLWPSVVGGYLYGFSSYELGHELGHPHLTAAFAVPLIALVVLRAPRGDARTAGAGRPARAPARAPGVHLDRGRLHGHVALVLGLALGLLLAPASRGAIRTLLGRSSGPTRSPRFSAAPILYYAATTFARRASPRRRTTRPIS